LSIKVTIRELITALPVLEAMNSARLPAFGAIKVAQLTEIIVEAVEKADKLRMDKLRELAEVDENGRVVTREYTDDTGSVKHIAKFKTEQGEQEMSWFWEGLQDNEVELPFTLKIKHFEPSPAHEGSGYLLSPKECSMLGRLLYRGDVIEDENEGQG